MTQTNYDVASVYQGLREQVLQLKADEVGQTDAAQSKVFAVLMETDTLQLSPHWLRSLMVRQVYTSVMVAALSEAVNMNPFARFAVSFSGSLRTLYQNPTLRISFHCRHRVTFGSTS